MSKGKGLISGQPLVLHHNLANRRGVDGGHMLKERDLGAAFCPL